MSEGMNVRKWECSPTSSRGCGTSKGARSGRVGGEIRNSKFEMRKLEIGNGLGGIIFPRSCGPDAGRDRDTVRADVIFK